MRRVLSLILLLVWPAVPVAAQDARLDRLAEVMRLDEVMEVMRDEGLAYGRELDEVMLGGEGGELFGELVAQVHDSTRMAATMRAALGDELTGEQMDAIMAFFDTPRGARILTLETSGRVAMSDPAVEEMARAEYLRRETEDDPRLAKVTRFIAVNDLVERNVEGGMASNFHFYRGMAETGGLLWDENRIRAEIWRQEPELRADTHEWMHAFLLMAYDPLPDADLDAYIAFSETGPGQALNAALFEGFERIYAVISLDLGRLVGRFSGTSEL